MPNLDYTDMPYEKKWSTGEHVISGKFYDPDPEYSESEEMYRGYYAHDLFGLRIEDPASDKNNSVTD